METIRQPASGPRRSTIAPENRGQRTSWRGCACSSGLPRHRTSRWGGHHGHGVALSTRKDATWTTWHTLPGVRASEGIDVLPKGSWRVPRPAVNLRRGCGPVELPTRSTRGTIRLGDPRETGPPRTMTRPLWGRAGRADRSALTQAGSRRTSLVAWYRILLGRPDSAENPRRLHLPPPIRVGPEPLCRPWMAIRRRTCLKSSVWGRRVPRQSGHHAAKDAPSLPGGGRTFPRACPMTPVSTWSSCMQPPPPHS